MKEELKKIANVLQERLNVIRTQGYSEVRLDAAMQALEELKLKLDNEGDVSSTDLNIEELVDDGTVDGD